MDPTSPRTTLRPRFGLKAIFFGMTALAIFVGYWAAAWRAASAIARRHNTVVDQLIDNLATPPQGATFRLHQTKAQLERFFGGGFGSGFPGVAASVLGRGSMNYTAMSTVQLDVSRLPVSDNPFKLVEMLRKHYEAGLADLGLRSQMRSESRAQLSEILSGQNSDLVVLIDVKVEETGTAEVRIIFIDSQTLDIW